MTSFRISVKPNERIYVNGAVLKFDRKTSLEFLNDVHFLLESQVLQADEANTPLKRLYFVVQILLMAPQDTQAATSAFNDQLADLLSAFEDSYVINELKSVDRLVKETRYHEAMKVLRALYPIEQRIFESMETSFPFEDSELLQTATG